MLNQESQSQKQRKRGIEEFEASYYMGLFYAFHYLRFLRFLLVKIISFLRFTSKNIFP